MPESSDIPSTASQTTNTLSPSNHAHIHPDEALFKDSPRLPVINVCDHYAGSEKLMQKALRIQEELGPCFDITLDCEDGAARAQERQHIEMISRVISSAENKYHLCGVRINGITNEHWRSEVDTVLRGCGDILSHITIPKAGGHEDVALVIDYIQMKCEELGMSRKIPVHVLIETHGALRDIWSISKLPLVRVLDFGLLDFISAHNGAIPLLCMKSPGQFEHELIRRAKADLVAAALANNLIPAHNITSAFKDEQQTRADARLAFAKFGFLRMWSIHPAQIKPIVEAMNPDFSAIREAEQILLSAQANNWAPLGHQGELHDRASYRFFWNLLRRAHHAGMPLSQEVEHRFFKGIRP